MLRLGSVMAASCVGNGEDKDKDEDKSVLVVVALARDSLDVGTKLSTMTKFTN